MDEPTPTPETSETPTSSSAYGKRPLWQWVALYAVIGVVVYGAIYYFFLAKKGGYSADNSMYNTNTPPAPTTTPVPTSSVQAEVSSISLTDTGFAPKALTIKAGTKVTWTNNSAAVAMVDSGPHPTHTDYPPLNLGEFKPGETLSLVFDKPGTYKYHNHLDASQFGSIVVQ